MAEKGIWWSLQPFLDDEFANPKPEGSENRRKQLQVSAGTDKAYELAKKHKVKVAWGTDILNEPKLAMKQTSQLAKMTRWFTPFEVLKMATSTNAELLGMCGERNPYKKAKLGEISEGAYADLIIVNGNPLENIKLIENPETNFVLIMKDGIIYKNALNK
jgi:imidazolonepropionase-like amidohydrolase